MRRLVRFLRCLGGFHNYTGWLGFETFAFERSTRWGWPAEGDVRMRARICTRCDVMQAICDRLEHW